MASQKPVKPRSQGKQGVEPLHKHTGGKRGKTGLSWGGARVVVAKDLTTSSAVRLGLFWGRPVLAPTFLSTLGPYQPAAHGLQDTKWGFWDNDVARGEQPKFVSGSNLEPE